MDIVVQVGQAPAAGDVRELGAGDTIWLEPALRESAEWSRFIDAVRHAVGRGADARWVAKP